jgi:hypothetical protein
MPPKLSEQEIVSPCSANNREPATASPASLRKSFFTSLKNLLPQKNSSFSEIWETVPFGNDIFFRSREKIFQLSNKTLNVYPAASEWLFLGESNNQLIAQDGKNGLLEFKGGVWSPFIKKAAFPSNYLVTCIFPFGTDSASSAPSILVFISYPTI